MSNIQEMQEAIDKLTEENKRLRKKVWDLKAKTSFKVWEENLSLSQENAALKEKLEVFGVKS